MTKLKPLTMGITTNCRKFLEMGIPDHFTCLLRNLYTGQEATVRTGHGTTDWFQIGKGLAQRFPASSVLAREGTGCGSVGDVPGAWLASAPLSPSLWT